jgi:hypothetical protein
MIKILYKVKYENREYDLIFEGRRYIASFSKYDDCIIIKNIIYICDELEAKKENQKIENRVLKDYETEYKQIYTLLKQEVLK